MNRFLSSQLSNTGSNLDVRTVTVDTSAATDALTQRTDALEAYTADLLESIRILEYVSYTEAARRTISIYMPYPSYVQISTASSNGISLSSSQSTRILNASGDLVSSAAASTDDVW